MPSIEKQRIANLKRRELQRKTWKKQLALVEEFMFCFTSHTKVHELILLRDHLEELIYG